MTSQYTLDQFPDHILETIYVYLDYPDQSNFYSLCRSVRRAVYYRYWKALIFFEIPDENIFEKVGKKVTMIKFLEFYAPFFKKILECFPYIDNFFCDKQMSGFHFKKLFDWYPKLHGLGVFISPAFFSQESFDFSVFNKLEEFRLQMFDFRELSLAVGVINKFKTHENLTSLHLILPRYNSELIESVHAIPNLTNLILAGVVKNRELVVLNSKPFPKLISLKLPEVIFSIHDEDLQFLSPESFPKIQTLELASEYDLYKPPQPIKDFLLGWNSPLRKLSLPHYFNEPLSPSVFLLTNLELLSINSAKLSETGLHNILKSLTKLRALGLNNCFIPTNFFAKLPYNFSIRHISLKRVALDNHALEWLGHSLPFLRWLEIVNCPLVYDLDYFDIFKLDILCSNLQYLIISGYQFIDWSFVYAWLSNSPHIKALMVDVTPPELLQHDYPRLKILYHSKDLYWQTFPKDFFSSLDSTLELTGFRFFSEDPY